MLHSSRARTKLEALASRREDSPNSCTLASNDLISLSPRSTGSGDERYSVPEARTARLTGGSVMRWAWTYTPPALSPARVIFSYIPLTEPARPLVVVK